MPIAIDSRNCQIRDYIIKPTKTSTSSNINNSCIVKKMKRKYMNKFIRVLYSFRCLNFLLVFF